MRAIAVGLVAALIAGCGSEPETSPGDSQARTSVAPENNRPPVIRSLQLVPDKPTAGASISVNLKAIDPDGDRLETHVEWFRNGQSHQSGSAVSMQTTGFSRGDQIYVIVRVSDGVEDVTERSAMVWLVNQTPLVTRIEIAPEKPHAGTDLVAIAETRDADGDPFELRYQWIVNGEKSVADATLPAGKFKRGDEVWVEITATDPHGSAEAIPSFHLTIPNGAPEIASNPSEATVGGGRYRYVIRAKDPDGDRPLRYTLIEGPDKMTVDLLSGVVTWRVPASAGGTYPIKVRIADPHGAETSQSFDIELSWQTDPASSN